MKQVKVLTITEIDLLANLLTEYIDRCPMFDVPKELEYLQKVLQQALVVKVEYSESPYFTE